MYRLLFFLVAVFTFSSCVDEKGLEGDSQDEGLKVFNVVIDNFDMPEGKVVFDGATGVVSWETGDQVAVSGPGSDEISRFTVSVGAESTTMSGVTKEADAYLALFPYDAEAKFTASSITTTLSATQIAKLNSFSSHIAVAKATGDALAFKNVLGLVKVTMTLDGITKLVFRGNNNETVAGTICITNLDNPKWTSVYGSVSQTITLESSTGSLAKGDYYFPILPQTFETGITIAAFSGDNLMAERVNEGRVVVYPSSGIKGDDFFSSEILLGEGTESNPYLISTLEQLHVMSSKINSTDGADMSYRSAYYKQTNDINVKGATIYTAGCRNCTVDNVDAATNAAGGCYFTGVYDGGGFKISNARIENNFAANKAVGLFGYADCHVKNLTMENPVIESSTTWNIGAIVGCMQAADPGGDASIVNCHVLNPQFNVNLSGDATSNPNTVGAVIGKVMVGDVIGCSVTGGEIMAAHDVGGIAGYLQKGTIQGSTITGTKVVSNAQNAGGITAQMANSPIVRIKDCSVENVSVTGTVAVGGAVGLQNANSAVATTDVESSSITATSKNVGGVAGDSYGQIVDCVCSKTTVSVGSAHQAGGIVGNACQASSVTGCEVSACTIECPNGNLGGIAGMIDAANVSNCKVTDATKVISTGSINVGGVVGFADGRDLSICKVENCEVAAGVTVQANGDSSGGIVGRAGHVIINGNVCAANVSSNTGSQVGGIAGGMLYNFTKLVINNIFHTGTISGNTATTTGAVVGACSAAASGSYIVNNAAYPGSTDINAVSGTLVDAITATNNYSSLDASATSLSALNAGVASYNEAPLQAVRAKSWVTGSNGHPALSGSVFDANAGAIIKVGLIGDSITTWQGWTTYPSNYQYPKSSYTDLTSVTQSYWYQLIYNKMTNAELDVNSSHTGTCVQETTVNGHPGKGFLQRYTQLNNPDIILINGGTNDSWSYKLPVGTLDFSIATENLDAYQFAQAYDKLIRLIKERYPSSRIMLIIGDALQDYSAYAQVIKDIAEHYDLPYADVKFSDRAACTYDNVHPNAKGMTEMADQIWAQIGANLKE